MSKTKSGPSAFGIWFADDAELAKMFGENIMKCKLTYENPKVITMDEWDAIRMEHTKDTEFFKNWKAKLISQGYDALFIKERLQKFDGHTVRDGNMVAVFDQDDAEIMNENVNENFTKAGLGSMILMTGEKQPDGTTRLYAIPIQRVLSYGRKKADNTDAQDANMVLLGDDYYRLTIQDGKIKPQKVGFSSKPNMLKALGMSEKNLSGERLKIVLNSKTGKTPLHWRALTYSSMGKMLSEMGKEIMELPNIKWYN
jgi:hypothetical protein